MSCHHQYPTQWTFFTDSTCLSDPSTCQPVKAGIQARLIAAKLAHKHCMTNLQPLCLWGKIQGGYPRLFFFLIDQVMVMIILIITVLFFLFLFYNPSSSSLLSPVASTSSVFRLAFLCSSPSLFLDSLPFTPQHTDLAGLSKLLHMTRRARRIPDRRQQASQPAQHTPLPHWSQLSALKGPRLLPAVATQIGWMGT